MKMKGVNLVKTKDIRILAASVAVAACARANATEFAITYSDSEGNTGSGTVYTEAIGNGQYLAQSGSFTLDANGSPYSGFMGSLVPTAGHGLWGGNGVYGSYVGGYDARLYGGTDLGFDNLIGDVGGTYSLSWWGTLFNDPSFSGPSGSGLAFDPSSSGVAGYNSDFGGQNYGAFNGFNNHPYFDTPSATITVTVVPDGGVTAGLLGAGLIGLSALRRKLSC